MVQTENPERGKNLSLSYYAHFRNLYRLFVFLALLNSSLIHCHTNPGDLDLSSSNGSIDGTSEEVVAMDSQIDPNNNSNQTGLSSSDGKAKETTEQDYQVDKEISLSKVPGTLCYIEGQEAAISPFGGLRLGNADNSDEKRTQATMGGPCGESETSPSDCTIPFGASENISEPELNSSATQIEGFQVVLSDSTVPDGLAKDDNYTSNITTLLNTFKNDSYGGEIVALHGIRHRLDPGGGLYNFAANSKGSKILASNKESKGASNILNKDKDKYLRIPCSVEDKFVNIELSEEALVDSVALANYEFYSSNPKEFELLGSLVYPTEVWFFMGKFQSENIRNLQTFTLSEPQPVKYLKLRMVSHYGADFYCTLSNIEVYGADIMEKMLEVWIAEEAETGSNKHLDPDDNASKNGISTQSSSLSQELNQEEDLSSSVSSEELAEGDLHDSKGKQQEGHIKHEDSINKKVKLDKSQQSTPLQSGRSGLEAVMKLLMQKVRSLEHNQPLIHHSLEEQNARLTEVLTHLDNELTNVNKNLGDAIMLISGLTIQLQQMEIKEQQDKDIMKANLSNKYHELSSEFDILRFQVIKMENKEMVAMIISLVCVILVGMMHILMQIICWVHLLQSENMFFSVCRQGLRIFPFLTCLLVILILSV